jgi:hypothetical protein
MPSILQRSDHADFLTRVYFGRAERAEDWLRACWRRAYRDFNRTLHGVSRNQDVYWRAEEALSQMLASVRSMNTPTQLQFDEWHREACIGLSATCKESFYSSLFVGQAQKWLNMTFKYIYVLGEERLSGFHHLYDLCHVPLDNIMIHALIPYGFKRLPCAWSRLNDYDVYLDRQHWIRNRFQLAPLDAEFQLWMGCSIEQFAVS